MLLWLLLASMSAAVAVALLQPLLRRGDDAPVADVAVGAVYRDQLAEVDADERRGVIGPEEAEAARREIARRLIASVDQATPASAAGRDAAIAKTLDDAVPVQIPSRPTPRWAIGLAAIIPLLALGLYVVNGAPGLPSQPIASRRPTAPVTPEIASLVKAVEARLKQSPDDGRGWDVIAPVYLKLARYGDAADAYARALRLVGESPSRLAGYAEALMLSQDGRVVPDARSALERLLKLEPANPRARFWLAFGLEQDGRILEAANEYGRLMVDLPADIPWRSMVEERHQVTRAQLAKGAPPVVARPTTDPPPGPTSGDIEAAAKLSETDRRAMIDGMVAGLAARLEKDGRDLAGWQRLIRALSVLGRKDEAVAALTKARASLADEPQSLTALADLAKSLGLGS